MISKKIISSQVKSVAQVGLTAKGIVYCLLGSLALMGAFNVGGFTTKDGDTKGVFHFIEKQTGGYIMLGLIALGLLCYSAWRGVQAFADTEHKGKKPKGIAARLRYLTSGLIYTSVAALALKMLFTDSKNQGDSKQNLAYQIINKPFGEWLIGIGAIIMIAVGIYQCYYGLSEKYRKHAGNVGNSKAEKIVLSSGKIGYLARGVVWLIIGYLFAKAALHSNSKEAGDTSKAFDFLAEASYGPYLLAAVASGFICYGIFNFIRVRYENF